MENIPKITAVAITLNEAASIERYLASVSIADEIVIVDSFSSDATVALAKAHPKVTVYQRTFDNFSAQKNFALSKASHDWILFFDLDEIVTPALSDEIQKTIASNPEEVAFFVDRDFYFMNKRIRYSGMQNDSVIRVFRKKHGRYNDQLVHETLEVDGATATLRESLPHYTYTSFDAYTGKIHRYSELQGNMLYEKKKKPSYYHFIVRPWWRFMHQFFIKLGILDGKEGFILAYVSAFGVFKRYVHLWLLYRKLN